jgi:hypothetical protein
MFTEQWNMLFLKEKFEIKFKTYPKHVMFGNRDRIIRLLSLGEFRQGCSREIPGHATHRDTISDVDIRLVDAQCGHCG